LPQIFCMALSRLPNTPAAAAPRATFDLALLPVKHVGQRLVARKSQLDRVLTPDTDEPEAAV
jgi:hypothetical protein